MKEAIKARVIDLKSPGNLITVMQFLKSSNETLLIGHPRDHAPITWQIGADKTNHDGEVYYRYHYAFCYINPSEIPGDLSRVNVISSHLKLQEIASILPCVCSVIDEKIFSLPRVVLWFPLLGLTPSGLFIGSILKSAWYSVGDAFLLQYCWPWAVVSNT